MTAPASKAKKGAKAPVRPCSCEYVLQHEANATNVIVNCKETNGPAALTAGKCRARALEILSQEVKVDTITLAHYRETQYTAPAMELLHRLERVATEFSHLSLRNPHKTHIDSDPDLSDKVKKSQLKECQQCQWNPMTYFDKLAKDVRGQDPSEFYRRYMNGAKRLLNAKQPKVCDPCLAATSSEMEYMGKQLAGLREFILYEGFRVVEAEGD